MRKQHSIETLFAVVLYGMFALLSLLLVLIGAQVYKRIVQNTEARGGIRASLSYVANKVRASDESGGVRLENRDGIDVLVFEETVEDATYETLIYYYDGALRELFQPSGTSFTPASGETLTAVTQFSMSEKNGLLIITAQNASEQPQTLHIWRRTA